MKPEYVQTLSRCVQVPHLHWSFCIQGVKYVVASSIATKPKRDNKEQKTPEEERLLCVHPSQGGAVPEELSRTRGCQYLLAFSIVLILRKFHAKNQQRQGERKCERYSECECVVVYIGIFFKPYFFPIVHCVWHSISAKIYCIFT